MSRLLDDKSQSPNCHQSMRERLFKVPNVLPMQPPAILVALMGWMLFMTSFRNFTKSPSGFKRIIAASGNIT